MIYISSPIGLTIVGGEVFANIGLFAVGL